ncbi:MAG: alpha/beta hydrolase fold domain-containing protein [Planctomycetales bacterium]|nr:alpha/beta hydrolase fold domain-containing protein [Planctomycetales bacterium]
MKSRTLKFSFMMVAVGHGMALLVDGQSLASPKPDHLKTYKTVGDVVLQLHVFEPPAEKRTGAAIVFFFGGGWNGGNPEQFYPQCQHLSERGMVAMAAEYRTFSRHKTSPFECVRDGKSAVRWIREHADELSIDTDRIAAGGGSAGGHVAACTALITGMDDETEDNVTSSMPSALVLFNPVIDTSEFGYGYERLKDRYKEISPLEHVRPNLPPTLIMQGDADTTTPPSGHREFERRMVEQKNECKLLLYPGETHGFFNPGRGDGSGHAKTTQAMTEFLESIDYVRKSN